MCQITDKSLNFDSSVSINKKHLCMKYPKISMITITYNSEQHLEETIKSVVEQNYPNLEYIIIDGGSKDHTLDIINKYREKISYVVSEPDKGICDAFNKGIKVATGDLIGIINSDDLQMHDTLKTVAENYNPEFDVIRGNIISWNDQTGVRVVKRPINPFSLTTSYFFNGLKKRSVCHACSFITKSAYEKWGVYQLKYKYMMDRDLLTRFYQQGAKFKIVDHSFAISRIGGITTQTPMYKKIREVRNVYLDNGGSYFGVIFRCAEFVTYELMVCALKFLKNLK